MTRESLGWVVAGVVVTLVCTLGAMQREGQVGRYQLVEGRYTIVTQKTLTATEAVCTWRIDTVTGETVMFQSLVGGKDAGSGWMPVRDWGE
jgi:hypothetical protein